MLYIILVPLLGLVFDGLVNYFLPRAEFKGADLLPFFFLPACNLITTYEKRPSFLPYGFLFYFILVIWVSCELAFKNKNISWGKTLSRLWQYLNICSVVWYLCLLLLLLVH